MWFGFPMILTNAIPGGIVVALLGFWPGVAAILVANLVMLVYVGLLSHRAGSTGENFALQATETFGRVGYILASGFLATIVVGWFAFNTGATGATLNSSSPADSAGSIPVTRSMLEKCCHTWELGTISRLDRRPPASRISTRPTTRAVSHAGRTVSPSV